MELNIKLNIKIDREGNVIFEHPLTGYLFLGRVFKQKDRRWSWEIPVRHRTEVVEGREHEDRVANMDPEVGVARRRDAVGVLVSFHWSRGYLEYVQKDQRDS